MTEHINTTETENVGSGEINKLIRLPKNIKQIGQADAQKRIYIEDYVVTFIRQRGKKNKYVLLGSSGMVGQIYASFIDGAIIIDEKWDEGNEFSGFSSNAWENIYKEIKENFPGEDILGWAYAVEDWEDTDNTILKMHISNFPGEDKVFFAVDTYSRDEFVYKYSAGALRKQKGYYMYYEKNEPMQSYMLKNNKSRSVESGFKDETTSKIRTIALKGYAGEAEKKEKKEEAGKGYIFVTTVLAVAMLTLAFRISTEGVKIFEGSGDATKAPYISEAMKVENTITLPPKVTPQVAQKEETTSEPKETPKVELTFKPDKTKKPQPTKEEEKKEPTVSVDNRTYIVKNGDTLAGISYKMYGSIFKVEQIMEANDITDKNMIVVGQKLIIP